MSAEIINLNRVRRAKVRAEREQGAKENRITFGRTRVERVKAKSEHDAETRRLDGHRRDDD